MPHGHQAHGARGQQLGGQDRWAGRDGRDGRAGGTGGTGKQAGRGEQDVRAATPQVMTAGFGYGYSLGTLEYGYMPLLKC